jgi:hypothetical protein
LKQEYSTNKIYPPGCEKQILIALSYYPELKNTSIKFVTRPNHSAGFTRETLGGLFEPPRSRHFLIVISDSTEPMLMPLIFKNLSFNAQIGLIGHELAHVSQSLAMTTLEIIKHGIKSLCPNHVDRYEGGADASCIAHGLGYQLLEWSQNVREKMNTVNWDGPDRVHRKKKRHRYMNPADIIEAINRNRVYDKIK